VGFFAKLLGQAGAETARGVLDGVGDLATKIRGAITGELPPEMQFTLEKLAGEADQIKVKGQLDINLAEAQSSSLFVAGWRPFIGWVCGLSLAWNYLLHPLIVWVMIYQGKKGSPPPLDLTELMPIVLGLLGLGVYRTIEKVKDAQGRH